MLKENKNVYDNYKRLLRLKKYGYSNLTITQYEKEIGLYLEAINKNCLDMTAKDITIYLDCLNLSPSCFNKKLSSIQNLYSLLIKSYIYEDKLNYNPANKDLVERAKDKHKKIKTALTKEQCQALLKNCKNSRDTAILTLYLKCALRVSELVALTLEQYNNKDLNGKIILSHTKGSKERVIFLDNDTINAVDNYILDRKGTCSNLFVSNYGNQMTPSCIGKTLKTILKRAILCGDIGENEVDRIYNHKMRRTSATLHLQNGTDLEIIQKMLGHSQISTTLLYAQLDDSMVANAMKNNLRF